MNRAEHSTKIYNKDKNEKKTDFKNIAKIDLRRIKSLICMKVGFINKKIFEEGDVAYITTEKRCG